MTPFSAYFAKWSREYYAHAAIGTSGDFYTAVSASKFFGGAIANFILRQLESGNLALPLDIIDIGANDFTLLSDICDFLDALGVGVAEKCRFIAVESASEILPKIPQIAGNPSGKGTEFLAQRAIPNLTRNAIFVANELFDAIPCELFDNGKMAFVENDTIIFRDLESVESCGAEMARNAEFLRNLAKEFGIIKGEIPLGYFALTNALDSANATGHKWIFLAFDYGSKMPQNRFTLRVFRKHKVYDFSEIAKNLGVFYGKSDITYNVHFGVLKAAFERIGAREVAFKGQDWGLVEDMGILEVLEKFYKSSAISHATYLRESNKVKTLLNGFSGNFHLAIYDNFKPKVI